MTWRADGVPGLDTGWAVLEGDRVVASNLRRVDAEDIVQQRADSEALATVKAAAHAAQALVAELAAALRRALPYVHDYAPMVDSEPDRLLCQAALAKVRGDGEGSR
jgi:hypothetical protein